MMKPKQGAHHAARCMMLTCSWGVSSFHHMHQWQEIRKPVKHVDMVCGGISCVAGSELDGNDSGLAMPRRGGFGEPIAAMKMNEQRHLAGAPEGFGEKQRADGQFLRLAFG